MKKIYLLFVCVMCAIMASAKEDISKLNIDYDNPVRITVDIRYTYTGDIAVRGQTKLLGVYVWNGMGHDVKMDLHFAAFKGGKVKEIYDSYGYFELGNEKPTSVFMPCIIGVPAGDYSFYPIVRFDGDPKWYMCGYWADLLEEDYMQRWKLTVLDSYDAPSCSYMANLDWGGSEPDACDIIYQYKLYEPFRVQTDLINNTDHTLKGKVKLIRQRNQKLFWRGFDFEEGDVKDEWMDCITFNAIVDGVKADNNGCFEIELAPGETRQMIYTNCMGTIYRDYGERWAPRVATYYLADGLEDKPENWKFVNESMWKCFDENKNLVEKYWGGVNTQCVDFFNESVANESITSNNISFDYINGHAIVRGMQKGQEVSVISISGKLITSKLSESENVSISLAGIPTGVYVATITENGKVIASHKFVK